jgi:hypothetical protein
VAAKSTNDSVKFLANYRAVLVGAPTVDLIRVVAVFEAEKKGSATLTLTPPVGDPKTVEVEVE